MLLRDRVPGADRPVVPAVGVAVLLGTGEEEDDGAPRLDAALHHRLGGEQFVDGGAGVVQAGTEVGVEMGRQKDRREVRIAAFEHADHVVADAAVLGQGDLHVARHRGRHRAAGGLELAP